MAGPTPEMAPADERPVVAVDCDEVLCQFVPAMAAYHNHHHGTNLTLADFHSYRFCEVWGGTDAESVDKVHHFFDTDFFPNIQPIPGAREALQAMGSKFRFVVVTSRQHVIQDATRQWLNKHFEGIFEDVLFGNHWTKDSPDPDQMNATKRTKLEMCQCVGAVALIDDAPSYAQQCAADLRLVVLFGQYGWNTGEAVEAALPAGVVRAADWTEVQTLLSGL